MLLLKWVYFLKACLETDLFELRTCLHIVNRLYCPHDCNAGLYKVYPLLNSIKKQCLELPLEELVCVDDQMVPFIGTI
jgi:hypothetical protein